MARARMARAGGAAASIELAHAGQYARTVDYAMGPDGFVRGDGIEVRAIDARHDGVYGRMLGAGVR